ncbi:uncharacterized protein MONBRDRAFT_28227 [Monosiga brevicollis MX1]|uniref:Major facilitator superfamily (MFS) profile domain-containing protein n=1 Tax=Monosiga brevicollis TaxID=81824 RepID=A9V7K0_MONBE|nr:uncharacterized protein MONBRDRAFT_28227 [Monosiga brevicollis MX1]EDQ86597.1 predicted protein [Monosiga brevicollis MX1]|eukprot:XP_001748710.1 hypothetical protein [Monosiga brevicollis MX1]
MALVLSLLVFRLLRMPSGIRGAQTPPLPSHYRSSSPPPTAPPHHHHHLHHHRGSPRSSHSGNSQVVLSRNEGYVAVDPGSASNTDTESDIETEVVVMEPLAPLEINNIADVLRLPHIHELALAYMCLNALRMFRGRRVLACHFALALSAVATLLLYLTQQWIVLACFFLIIMGGGSGGTDVILSTSMAIDLGREANCITLVAGYIGGMGALGAMLQAPVVSLCLYLGGKSGVLWAMILLTVAASASVSRARALDTKRSLSVSQLSAKAAQ